MVSMNFEGHELELTRDLFVQLMSNSICGVYPLIENLYTSMLMGYPLVEDEFISLLFKGLSMLEQLEQKTEEAGLKAAIKQVRNNLQALLAETNRAAEWIASLLGLSKAGLKRLEYYGSLQDVGEEGLPSGNASLPNWVNMDPYQAFLERCTSSTEALITGIEVFLARLEIHVDKYGIQYDWQYEQGLRKDISKLREFIKKGGLKPAP